MPRRALIVDDEADVCELMRNVLSSTGMDVVALTKSGDAVSYLHDEKFTVVLFDLRMPAPDGNELTRLTRGSCINQMTPIILVSDDQSPSVVSHGFAAGASFFLYKPVDRAQLLKLVRATQGAVEHEKRRFRRVTLRSKVRLTFDQQEWDGETVDVSLNGMLVKGPGAIPLGSNVRVNLFVAGGRKPIVGNGCIARIHGRDLMGVYLNRLTLAESARLQDFLLPMIQAEEPEASAVNR